MYNTWEYLIYIVATIVFVSGMYFYVVYKNTTHIESMTNIHGPVRCPNLLVQKNSKYYLYNTKLEEVPGVNPIVFDSLEDYTEFLDWQQSIGIKCPVLYVQSAQNIQGEHVYKIRPSVTQLHCGAPSTTPSSHKLSIGHALNFNNNCTSNNNTTTPIAADKISQTDSSGKPKSYSTINSDTEPNQRPVDSRLSGLLSSI